MKITKKHNPDKNDIEVLIEYPKPAPIVDRLYAAVVSVDSKVRCVDENREVLVGTSDIYYIESVDKKSFVYLVKDVYRCEMRLFQIEDMLIGLGFVKISKSVVLNINMLQSVRPLFNSRMEAVLINGEKLNISRKYLPDIRRVLEGM